MDLFKARRRDKQNMAARRFLPVFDPLRLYRCELTDKSRGDRIHSLRIATESESKCNKEQSANNPSGSPAQLSSYRREGRLNRLVPLP
jgi:hypothetical protein